MSSWNQQGLKPRDLRVAGLAGIETGGHRPIPGEKAGKQPGSTWHGINDPEKTWSTQG